MDERCNPEHLSGTPGTGLSEFQRIYLAGLTEPPFFSLGEFRHMPVVARIRRYSPAQVEYVLGQLTLRRSKSALQLQLAKALVDLERHFGEPVRRPPTERAQVDPRGHWNPSRPRVRRFRSHHRPLINFNEGRGIRRWG